MNRHKLTGFTLVNQPAASRSVKARSAAFTLVELPAVSERKSSGFTLVELLVVIAMIGILVATMLPALQASRETVRRTSCTNNMRQLILAVHNYELAQERLPPGTVAEASPIENLPNGQHISWIARVLPYIDEPNKFRQIDFTKSAYARANVPVREMTIPTLICPSEESRLTAMSSYAGSHHDTETPIAEDNRGALVLNRALTRDELSDGVAYTLILGEKCTIQRYDLGWLSGSPATLRNTGHPLNLERYQPADPTPAPWLSNIPEGDANNTAGGNPDKPLDVGGFGSWHVYGANLALGDGSVRFFAEDTPAELLRQLANRQDGALIDRAEW